MLISIEFAINFVFESSVPFGSGIMVLCNCAVVIEDIKNEYFVFDPHSGRIPSLSSESGACPLSIIKSMVELCSVLRDLACSLIDKARSEIQYDLILLHMKYATETQQKTAYKQVHFTFQVYFYFYLTKRGKKFEDTKWTIRNRK